MSQRNNSRIRKISGQPSRPEFIAANDNLHGIFAPFEDDLVPDWAKGTDQYLDVICWNIRFFNHRDPERTRLISNIMSQLNADIFVCEEIEQGALDPVASNLQTLGAGLYKTAYGSNGGTQRVAIMYDTEWMDEKEDISELFTNPQVIASNGKNAFPRYPLHANFVAYSAKPQAAKPRAEFDFHLVGLHLKSQRPSGGDDGSAQRTAAAKRLAEWLDPAKNELGDEPDAIVLGDWNAKIDKPEWKPLIDLENKGNGIRFAAWNDKKEASHFYRNGKGTLLDMVSVTESAAKQGVDKKAKVVHWTGAFGPDNRIAEMVDKISDHMPVLTRFYFGNK